MRAVKISERKQKISLTLRKKVYNDFNRGYSISMNTKCGYLLSINKKKEGKLLC